MKAIILKMVAGELTACWGTNAHYSFFPAHQRRGAVSLLTLVLLTVAMVAMLWVATFGADTSSLMFAGMGMTSLVEKKNALAKLYKELESARTEIETKGVDQKRGEEIEAKAKEAESLQAEVDQAVRIQALAAKGREFNPDLPDTKKRGSSDGNDGPGRDDEVVGYLSLGDAFVNSDEFKEFVFDRGAPQGVGTGSRPMVVKSATERFIAITRKMRGELEAKMSERASKGGREQKAIPTLTGLIIQPDRLTEVVRTTENQRLTLRDVLNVSRTDSNLIEYMTVTASSAAAAPVAENAAKPEASSTFALATSPVRTLAVWQPITEQQLSDAPQLADFINNDLIYDLQRLEERQVMYGSGAGENLQGILTLAGVPLITRTVTATTNIDRIRIGATDVMVAGYEPNAVLVHPIDWEAVVLAKGTDNRYIWALIETDNGPRIWGMSVVETVAMKNPANLQRYLLVGDFIRGATLWDRQEASVSVGWVNDDFIKNRRTIRAEERVAFGVKRPTAFARYETATAV